MTGLFGLIALDLNILGFRLNFRDGEYFLLGLVICNSHLETVSHYRANTDHVSLKVFVC